MTASAALACLDIGSTFTQGLLVTDDGTVLTAAQSPTTVETDVLDGVAHVLTQLRAAAPHPHVEPVVLACSSAGGGLRIAVVGAERVVTAAAGRIVAMTAGGRVVHVAAGPVTEATIADIAAARPDLLLVVGGTDGGNPAMLLANAQSVGAAALSVPVVLAGNVDAAPAAAAALQAGGAPVVVADNVLPEIGRLAPESAREALRAAFLEHVIGGKGLTSEPARLRRLVRAATPDAVLVGVERLAAQHGGDVLVVDVGGATTDVYSVVDPARQDQPGTQAVAPAWRLRTVEADLGMRWSAPGVVAAAVHDRLLAADAAERLAPQARRRAEEPGWLPGSVDDEDDDATLARLAVVVATRRHARPSGRDLSRVGLLVGSGGVLRHLPPRTAHQVLAAVPADRLGGWAVPTAPRGVVDDVPVLAAAGLLTMTGRDAIADRLLARVLA
jgi:uncharacterized protein (TIGR01319 family)